MSHSDDFTPCESEDQSLANEITAQPNESLSELKGLNLGRIEDSWAAIAAAYKEPHQRLLVLDWVARYYKIPSGIYRKGFDLWLKGGSY